MLLRNTKALINVYLSAHKALINVYFELEAHLDHKMEYRARLGIASINITPRFVLMRG